MSFAISPTGVQLIASFEGFVNGAYNDSRGLATCGYGHLLHMSGATAADHRQYGGKGRAFFLDLLAKDIERVCIGPMNAKIHVPLSQGQVDALASLVFNCGAGALDGTIGRRLNAKNYHGAADAFLLWANPLVLRARRERERDLFLRARASSAPLAWLTPDEKRWVTEYDALVRENKDQPRRGVLRRVMGQEAAKIAQVARTQSGWERASRRQRYHSLIARSS